MAGKVGAQVYRSPRWRVLRRNIFKRDGFKCVKCSRPGRLECDHIRPIAKAGDWFDPKNLRTLCRGCHIQITRDDRRREKNPERAKFEQMAREIIANGP